jgi:P pilus assembly chaperone PapD
MKYLFISLFIVLSVPIVWSQAGISVSPGRLYYKLGLGGSSSQSIKLMNPNDTELEIGVSFSDWNYEKSGANHILESNSLANSCVNWIQVLPSSYFVIQPGETKEIEVFFKVPNDADTSIPVHNAMIFFTQLNPGQAKDENGAAIQVTVRMGVKIYHSFSQKTEPILEITDFKNYIDDNKNKFVLLQITNHSTIWADGKVKWEIFDNTTGKKSCFQETDFFTLPNDQRELNFQLPKNLEKGNYTIYAQMSYGETDVIKVAELEFKI